MQSHQLMGAVAAFLFASLAFSLTFSFATFWQVPVSLSSVLAHALVLGLPIFVIFWWKRWVNVITCICGGFIVAAASGVLPNLPRMRPKGSHESVRGVARVIDGVPTAAAWQDFGQTLIFLGVFGAIAGAVFIAVLHASDALTPAGSPTDPSGQARQPAPRAGPATALAVVAVLLTGGLLAMPNVVWERLARIAEDRTCHNVLRDRASISPQVSMQLEITAEERPKLTQAMADFAAAHGLMVRSYNDAARLLSLCHDRGLTIHLGPGSITVFELQPGSDWQQTTKALIARIETLWPGKLRFRAPQGGEMPRPKELL